MLMTTPIPTTTMMALTHSSNDLTEPSLLQRVPTERLGVLLGSVIPIASSMGGRWPASLPL